MRVKIKVENEAAGTAVFNAIRNHGATDQTVYTEVMGGKNLAKFSIHLDVLISKNALQTFLKTLPQRATLQ